MHTLSRANMLAARLCTSVPAAVPARRASSRRSSPRVPAARSRAAMPAAVDERAVAVLFDFDGTLGDTETPAMRVAFWELAPYFPDATAESLTVAARDDFVRANAGKAFEFMVDVVEEDRAKAGMPPIEDVRSGASEHADVLSVVDGARRVRPPPPGGDPEAGQGPSDFTKRRDRGCARGPRRALPRRAADPRVAARGKHAVFHRHHQREAARAGFGGGVRLRGVLPARGDPLGRERLRPAEVQARPERVPARRGEDRRAPKSVRRGGGQHVGRGERFQRENRTHRRLRRRVAASRPTRRTRTL